MNLTNVKIIITAIICLTILESIALFKGINGTIFSLMIAVIAGLAGLVMPTPNIAKKIKDVINNGR